MKIIIYKGNKIPIHDSTAKKFHLKNGHVVKSEKEFIDIIDKKKK